MSYFVGCPSWCVPAALLGFFQPIAWILCDISKPAVDGVASPVVNIFQDKAL